MSLFKEEVVISRAAAQATADLIQEYQEQGGVGHDEAALQEMLNALITADRIVITHIELTPNKES